MAGASDRHRRADLRVVVTDDHPQWLEGGLAWVALQWVAHQLRTAALRRWVDQVVHHPTGDTMTIPHGSGTVREVLSDTAVDAECEFLPI